MPFTLSLNTNPLVNRFAEPDDLIETIATASASATCSSPMSSSIPWLARAIDRQAIRSSARRCAAPASG